MREAGRAAVVAAYAIGASRLAPFTWPIQVAVTLPVVVIVGSGIRRGSLRGPGTARSERARAPATRRPRRQCDAPGERALLAPRWAVAVWLVLIVVAASVQVLNYTAGPRDVHPTLSYLASHAFSVEGVRAASFALWVWFGWSLVVDR